MEEEGYTDHQRAYLHFFFQKIWVQDKKIMEVEYTPALQVLNEAKLGILSANWLRVPSIALTTALDRILKAFQNPIWSEQARERLKQIKMLTKVASV